MANFINKYATTAAYSNSDEVAARAALGGNGTVSLDAEKKEVHYDGINIEIPRKAASVGTCVYADSNGGVHFLAGDTVKSSAIQSGWELAGVVALRKGNKALVLHKSENTSIRFTSCWAWEIVGITYDASNTIQFMQNRIKSGTTDTIEAFNIGSPLTFTPTDIDSAVSSIDTFLKANQGGTSEGAIAAYNWHCEKINGKIWVISDFTSPDYRQYQGKIVNTSASTTGIDCSLNMWELAGCMHDQTRIVRNDGYASDYYSIWNKDVVKVKGTNGGSPQDAIGTNGYYNETNFNNSTVLKAYYGTYDNYLEAMLARYPEGNNAMGEYARRGAEISSIANSVMYTKLDGSTTAYMFTAIHYTKTLKAHSTASVEGMNEGDWYMPGIDEIVAIFSQMKVDGSDAIHTAFANAGLTSVYPINPSSNVDRWVPARSGSRHAWLLSTAGLIGNYYFYNGSRAVGVSLLEL